MEKTETERLIHFTVTNIRGLYVPFVGGFIRLIAPEDLPRAQYALAYGRKAWLN